MEGDAEQSTTGSSARALERIEETLWVIEARNGDGAAFERLLARYERPLLYYLRRFIRQPEAAFDAHQEVWVDAFRGLGRLRTPESFRLWIYRIAHDKAVRFIRSEIRKEQFVEPLEEEHQSVVAEFEESCDAELIHKALDRLPALQREVLTLHYLRDLSLGEIAVVLDCPIGTIKSRLHHARGALRKLVEKERL